MKRKLRILQMSVLLILLCLTQQKAEAQVLASNAAITKVARMSIAEGIATKNRVLLDLITKAGLMPVLSGGEEYTFFAPPQEAMQKLQTESPDRLKELFLGHIIAGRVTSADLPDGANLKTLNGGTLRICRKKDTVWIDGLQLQEADQLFTNGVLHQLSGTVKPDRKSF